MAKLFVSLFLMVLASFVMFIGLGIAFEAVGNKIGAKADIEERMSKGTFKLLDSSLQVLNADEKQSLIKKYQLVFGPEFALVDKSKLNFDLSQQQQLERKEVVVIDDVVNLDLSPSEPKLEIEKTVNLIFRKHLDTDLVWRIHLDSEVDLSIDNFSSKLIVDGGRFIDGMFFVLEHKLKDVKSEDLSNTIDELVSSFDLILKFLDKTTIARLLESKPEVRPQFQQNKVINITQGSNFGTFLHAFPDNTQALQIGPIEIPWFIRNALHVMLFVFIFSISTALFIWLWPLWSNLLKIKTAANKFGQGDYSARIPYRKRSSIAPVAKAFNSMAKRTQQSINTQKELTSAVSHELRTPVARMRFALEMLEESDTDDDKKRYVESINSDIDDLDLLLEELLSYARLDQENTELNLRLVKLTPWLSLSIDKLMPLANDKLLNYQIDGIGINESATFEPRLMTRLLDNLVQNALRYANNTVEVTLNKDAQHYVLTVEDDGKGISKADQTHIFDAFSRIDSSRNRSTGGFGLGLAIVDRIIKVHQGTITIEDSKMGGACFVVRWPIIDKL